MGRGVNLQLGVPNPSFIHQPLFCKRTSIREHSSSEEPWVRMRCKKAQSAVADSPVILKNP